MNPDKAKYYGVFIYLFIFYPSVYLVMYMHVMFVYRKKPIINMIF